MLKNIETLKGSYKFKDFQKFLPHCYRKINYVTRNRKSAHGKTRGFVQASKLQKKRSRLSLMQRYF
ncbi:UNVERIFIED_CONTAM: hypothetical protein NCL1_62356 [Trichonephila clavipes]